MKKFLLTLSLFLATAAHASPTLDYVKALHPTINPQRAARLARSIDAAAKRYEQDPFLLAAIAMKESTFRNGIVACHTRTKRKTQETVTTCDYGMMQINQVWIAKWKLDPDKLQNDHGYNTMVAARILRMLQRYHGHEPNWFGRYHSATPKYRARYEAALAYKAPAPQPDYPLPEYVPNMALTRIRL